MDDKLQSAIDLARRIAPNGTEWTPGSQVTFPEDVDRDTIFEMIGVILNAAATGGLVRADVYRPALKDVTNALGQFVNTDLRFKPDYDHPLAAYDRAVQILEK